MRALATPLARSAAAFGTPPSRRRARDAAARRHRASATTRAGAGAPPRDEMDPAVFVARVEIETDAEGEETSPVAVACAELRARCFYVYDPLAASSDGSIVFGEAAARAKTRWREKRAKTEARRMRQMTPLGMRVSTYAATCRAPSDARLAMEIAASDAREENGFCGGAWTRGGGVGADAEGSKTTETGARPIHTGSRTTPFAWCTPILKDFCRRISPPRVPRFQYPPSTPHNSASDAFQRHPDVRSYRTTLRRRRPRSVA
jgi:hypothetical protein